LSQMRVQKYYFFPIYQSFFCIFLLFFSYLTNNQFCLWQFFYCYPAVWALQKGFLEEENDKNGHEKSRRFFGRRLCIRK